MAREHQMNGRQRRPRRRRQRKRWRRITPPLPKFNLILRNERDMVREMDELADLFARLTICV